MNNIIKSDISYEMKTRFPVYALSVIQDRALPDIRDGLKPVHRRILYSIQELGIIPEKGYKKCARIVGEVLGKYHPHGDSSVYEALVRMAQDFNMRYVLVDGHGNFGSVDGDNAAAMRYTEAKMKPIMIEMLRDINKNTVDFRPNFDGEEEEPTVLPSRFPNILVNGSSGIAVGMATNIPPHNLKEVISGLIEYVDNNDITTEELMNYIPAPDFPTKGIITNKKELINMYKTGEGKITVRSKYHIEHENNMKQIVFTEIPYQVNKQKLCLFINNLCEKEPIILKNVVEVRDETDREGMRIVVEIKKNENEETIISYLFGKTKLQNNFCANFNMLVNGSPKVLGLKDILKYYSEYQQEVLTRRSEFELNKAEERNHILEGQLIALNDLDKTISIIKNSKLVEDAKVNLMNELKLSEKQAINILELKLRRLTNLEQDKINEEHNELTKQILFLQNVLSDKSELIKLLKDELIEIRDKYGDNRLTEIKDEEFKPIQTIKQEDLIEDFTTTLIFTEQQYFKKCRRYSEDQNIKDGDTIKTIVQDSNKSKVLFFSNQGNIYIKNIWELNENKPSNLGQYLPNLLPLETDETIIGMISTNNYKGDSLIIYPDGHLALINLEKGYYTKQNSTKLKNGLSKKMDLPIYIGQIIDDVEIELTDVFGKTKTISTKDINRKDSRNSQGVTAWNSKKKDWKLTLVNLLK